MDEEPDKRSKEEKADELLLELATLEERRSLLPSELVLRGRCIQMGSGAVVTDYKEAEKAFWSALEIDPKYVPALLELGWFYYAPEDKASIALPFFEQALEVSLDQLKEAIQGKKGCLEELDSEEAASNFVQGMVRDALKVEDFNDEAEPID